MNLLIQITKFFYLKNRIHCLIRRYFKLIFKTFDFFLSIIQVSFYFLRSLFLFFILTCQILIRVLSNFSASTNLACKLSLVFFSSKLWVNMERIIISVQLIKSCLTRSCLLFNRGVRSMIRRCHYRLKTSK